MFQKNLLRVCLVVTFIIIFILIILLSNRYIYGNWNPFAIPSRIACFHRIYSPSSETVILSGADKPVYSASIVNLFLGKQIYMKNRKGDIVPTVIYLKIGNDTYLPYELQGGP